MNISYILCAAGNGTRFQSLFNDTPKALIKLFGETLLERSLRSLTMFPSDQLIIITQKQHKIKDKMLKKLSHLYPFIAIEWIEIEEVTRGQLETACLAKNLVPHKNAVSIFNCDTFFQSKFLLSLIENEEIEGIIPSAEVEGNSWSFSVADESDNILKVAEKERISRWGSVGYYYFKNSVLFFNKAQEALKSSPNGNNEYYIAPLYNEYIQEGYKIKLDKVSIFKAMGTPEQIQEFWNYDLEKFKLENNAPVLVIDLDNTITIEDTKDSYPNKKPNLPLIKKMQEFHDAGWEIIIYTSRRMQTHNNEEAKILKDIGQITFDWLEKHKVPYDGIRFGKPFARNGYYVDDKALSPKDFLSLKPK